MKHQSHKALWFRGLPYSSGKLTRQIRCAKRTGKQRYPSEKKRLRTKQKELLSDSKEKSKFEGTWRLFKLAVPFDQHPGKDSLHVSDALLQQIATVLKFPVASLLPPEAFTIVRESFDARKDLCVAGWCSAGTWSDGKLVTRIGRNSGSVLAVMRTLVHFGAPKQILIDGKPHLGTDRLVPLLRNVRQHLQDLGVTIKFGTKVDDLVIKDRHVLGVMVSESADKLHLTSQKMEYDAVILAVGHSARYIYEVLLAHNVELIPKDFTYAELASEVCHGRGKIPVADYKVANYIDKEDFNDVSDSGVTNRSCYSFCMCPGGQVVLTSTSPSEICINGMSFSRRASKWANAALVVTVTTKDFEALNYYGPLAGVKFQRVFEQRAAMMGGGNFIVPVQTVTDFLENKLSVTSVPPSSYRLGVKAANLHQLFPIHVTEALKHSLVTFDKELPGFICNDALLHGVETRTSSPIQIPRNGDSYECTSVKGLYPVGEGAGYAGGIISAAVDGMHAGFAVAKKFSLFHGDVESVLGKAQNVGVVKY
ncbi:Hypothetical protein glysoja_048653 [Glycine soja]|uniref:FAD-dependent protein C-terminal domain-containing protein n=1 Tax=Glycine soja TaxID=3848 RepID=A0A0B2PNA3_GLYSO|nr:Hypothetical protein glysoja_048653 [Glycine soja]